MKMTANPALGISLLLTLASPSVLAASLSCTATVKSEWQTGYNLEISMKNEGSSAVSGWSVGLDFDDGTQINKIWNAVLNQNRASDMAWNAVIGAGQSKTFGMNLVKGTPNTPATIPTLSQDCQSNTPADTNQSTHPTIEQKIVLAITGGSTQLQVGDTVHITADGSSFDGMFHAMDLYINNAWKTWKKAPFGFDVTLDQVGTYRFKVEGNHSSGEKFWSDEIEIQVVAQGNTGNDTANGETNNSDQDSSDNGATNEGVQVGALSTEMLDIFGHSVPVWKAGVEGGIPNIPAKADVSDFGAIANDNQDDAQAFKDAIASIDGVGAVTIPAGDFNLNSGLRLPSGVVLRGAGMDKTHLLVKHNQDALEVKGTGSGYTYVTANKGYPTVLEGATKGSLRIRVNRPSDFAVGGDIELVQGYNPSLHETKAGWRQSWAGRLVGHFTKVTAIDGQWITLADPIRIDMDQAYGVWATPANLVDQVGFEDFKITRLDRSNTNTIRVNYGSNVWAKGIHSVSTSRSHFGTMHSRRLEVRDSYFEKASDYGTGGHGYGVEFAQRTTASLAINNTFRHLRHAMMTHLGANGNVFAYNYSREPHQDEGGNWIPADISIHGHYSYSNLFESNVAQLVLLADYWGPTGPDNVFLRNSVRTKTIAAGDSSNHQYMIGNKVLNGGIELDGVWGAPGYKGNTIDRDTWVIHGNYTKLNKGVDSEPGFEGVPVPTSYIFKDVPAFFGNKPWPALGSDIDQEQLPAEAWYFQYTHQTPDTPNTDTSNDPVDNTGTGSDSDDSANDQSDGNTQTDQPAAQTNKITLGIEGGVTGHQAGDTLKILANGDGFLGVFYAMDLYVNGKWTAWTKSPYSFDYTVAAAGTYRFKVEGNHSSENKYWSDELVVQVGEAGNDSNDTEDQTDTNDPGETDTNQNDSDDSANDEQGDTDNANTNAAVLSCKAVVVSEWQTGYTMEIQLTNTGADTVEGWRVDLQFADNTQVASMWRAQKSGNNPVTASNYSWNSQIAAGQTVKFGFSANKAVANQPATVPTLLGSSCQ